VLLHYSEIRDKLREIQEALSETKQRPSLFLAAIYMRNIEELPYKTTLEVIRGLEL